MVEFVSVPVPAERVQEVYELVARSPVNTSAVMHPADGSWSSELVDRMFIESSSAMRRILSAIAKESPSWVTTDDVATASGLTVRQVVASLGPFEKRVRGRYGMCRWPFEAREFVDEGIFKYSMSAEIADWVLASGVRLDEIES